VDKRLPDIPHVAMLILTDPRRASVRSLALDDARIWQNTKSRRRVVITFHPKRESNVDVTPRRAQL
jgi:hypothetical protein